MGTRLTPNSREPASIRIDLASEEFAGTFFFQAPRQQLCMPTKPARSVKKKVSVNGRPGKRTPQIEKTLLEAVSTGAPYRIASHAAGISEDTFARWRQEDPEFARKVEVAAGRTAVEIMKRIRKHGEESFQPLAWMMERRYPESFGRPEVQLHQSINQQTNINNTLVISVEDADRLETRAKKLEAEADTLLAAREARSRASDGDYPDPGAAVRNIEAEVVTDVIQLPPTAQRSASWWRSLSRGDGARGITAQAALFVIETVTVQVYGIERAAKMEIEFDDSEPKLRDVHSVIADLCGPQGWQTLIELGGES
jgi:hypothetical protein